MSMPAELTITRAVAAYGFLVAARGVIDVRSAVALQRVLVDAAFGGETLTVDFSELDVRGGAALLLLVNGLRRVAATRPRVRVVCPAGTMRPALERTGVARRLELLEGLDATPAVELGALTRSARDARRAATARRRNRLLADATLVIEAHHSDPDLRLATVARRIATSSRQLQRVLDELAGTHFRAELNAVRMQHAAELLLTTDLSVAEIAARVGHRQPAQFARAFRRFHGEGPRAFSNARGGRRD
jgi:AraC-like DNA-binding protein